MMKLKHIDLDPRYEYMMVYRDIRDDTISTRTLDEGATVVNYKQMKNSGNVEFFGIYRKLKDEEIMDMLIRN